MSNKGMSQVFAREMKCPICGKNFVVQPFHTYKDKRHCDGKYVCSYKCVCESIRLYESKKGVAKMLERTRKELKGI